MMKIARTVILALVALPASNALAQTAAKTGEVSAFGVAIDIVLLVAGLICFVMCLKIFALLRGGELSPGWQVLAVSFLIFSLGQLLNLAIKLDIVTMQKNAIGILQLLALILVAVGVTKIKKSLT
ncbi:MAG: hypothetical protein E4G91_05280 [Candidatus Zixiibacteriota bacterium]|nr:MAG: hypothetical protein E4G91_05280 [candidate division Zixibacteria bacterium]